MLSGEPIPISALQHWSYCPRQAALIHVDGAWSDNPFTRRGTLLHARVDQPGTDRRPAGVRVERALPLFSRRLGLTGRADVVEFHPGGAVVPIEYKAGRRRHRLADDLQLCAQALCLEEMLGCPVPEGAVFHGPERRRRGVAFGATLRAGVEDALAALRAVLDGDGALPAPVDDGRCPDCSLRRLCLPELPRGAGLPDPFRPADEAACGSF